MMDIIVSLISVVKSFMHWHFWNFTSQSWLLMIVYCGLAYLCTYVAIKLIDELGLIVSYLLALMSPLFMNVYFHHAPDAFWFCDFDKMGWLIAIPGVLVAYVMMFLLFKLAVGFLKNICTLFSAPLWSILMVILGLLWFGTACNAIGAFFDKHPFLGFFLIIGMIPARKTPTIYVEGVGHITGHGYNGGSSFRGDDGNDYHYDGKNWH